jgi:hypothetical protein
MRKEILTLLFCLVTLITYSQEYKFGKISKEALEEKVYAKDSVADAVYLYNSRRTYYEYNSAKGFEVITKVHQRIKIYNKKGFDLATFNISCFKPKSGSKEKVTSIKGYTYNIVNGKTEKTLLSKKSVFNERLNKYRVITKFTMPNIKEGAVIEVKYQVVSPFPFSLDNLQFQYNIPVKKISYKVEIPEYFVFNLRSKGYLNINLKRTREGGTINWTERTRTENRSARMGSSISSEVNNYEKKFIVNVYSYSENDIPALRDDEPYVNNIHNYRGGVEFELTSTKFPNSMLKLYTTSWKDVVKTIYKSSSFGNELEKVSYFKKDLSLVLATAKNDQEKLITVLDFVKSKVKWNDFTRIYTDVGVRKAYKEGRGNVADINLMLTAMLKEAGFNAKPILLSTRAHGMSFFPTRDGFNYVIAGVQMNDKVIYLDATEKYSAPNVLPLRAVNWKGRIINDKENSDWVDLIPTNYALDENYLAISLDKEKEVSGMLRTVYTNLNALNYRSKNNHLKEDVVIETLESKYNIEIEDFKITNRKNVLKPVVRTIKFNGEDLVEEINGKIYVSPLFFLTSKINPFKLKERKFPVDFGVPLRDKNTIKIKIPEGYKVESLPTNIAIGISNNIGVFRYKIVATPKKLVIVSQLQINKAIITPEYYQELKEFYNQMIKKQTEKITLIKK